ncbi:UNKNOWN [Stylonychia lemnae]|uniref:Uncharacterized protein n=1 Tax=Stylonychia lemnae TaxID=5949 RepID=A0A078A3Q3_STYLE|nr:UNKNOWN [Stylonychia lemnae]|eukprot:CDW75379.1 UNKNOWN [Stylonychia lemnae]
MSDQPREMFDNYLHPNDIIKDDRLIKILQKRKQKQSVNVQGNTSISQFKQNNLPNANVNNEKGKIKELNERVQVEQGVMRVSTILKDKSQPKSESKQNKKKQKIRNIIYLLTNEETQNQTPSKSQDD